MALFLHDVFEADVLKTVCVENVVTTGEHLVWFAWSKTPRKAQLTSYGNYPQKDNKPIHASLSVHLSDGKHLIPTCFTANAVDQYKQKYQAMRNITSLQYAFLILKRFRIGLHRIESRRRSTSCNNSTGSHSMNLMPRSWSLGTDCSTYKYNDSNSTCSLADFFSPENRWEFHIEIDCFELHSGAETRTIHDPIPIMKSIMVKRRATEILAYLEEKSRQHVSEMSSLHHDCIGHTDYDYLYDGTTQNSVKDMIMHGVNYTQDSYSNRDDFKSIAEMLSQASLPGKSPPLMVIPKLNAQKTSVITSQPPIKVSENELTTNSKKSNGTNWEGFTLDQRTCSISHQDMIILERLPGWQPFGETFSQLMEPGTQWDTAMSNTSLPPPTNTTISSHNDNETLDVMDGQDSSCAFDPRNTQMFLNLFNTITQPTAEYTETTSPTITTTTVVLSTTTPCMTSVSETSMIVDINSIVSSSSSSSSVVQSSSPSSDIPITSTLPSIISQSEITQSKSIEQIDPQHTMLASAFEQQQLSTEFIFASLSSAWDESQPPRLDAYRVISQVTRDLIEVQSTTPDNHEDDLIQSASIPSAISPLLTYISDDSIQAHCSYIPSIQPQNPSETKSNGLSIDEVYALMQEPIEFPLLPITQASSSITQHPSTPFISQLSSLSFERSSAAIDDQPEQTEWRSSSFSLTSADNMTISSSLTNPGIPLKENTSTEVLEMTQTTPERLAETHNNETMDTTISSRRPIKRKLTVDMNQPPRNEFMVMYYNLRLPKCGHHFVNPVTKRVVKGCANVQKLETSLPNAKYCREI